MRVRGWRSCVLLASIWTGASSPCALAQVSPNYATPGINHRIYKEGEVKRYSGKFEGWTLACDEVSAINQRFCSMSVVGVDAASRPVVSLIVSTNEQGRPAALLQMPFGVLLTDGLRLATEQGGAKPAGKPLSLKLAMVQCDRQACMTVFPLPPEFIGTLAAGRNLHLYFSVQPNADLWGQAKLGAGKAQFDVLIKGAGFAGAINASQKKFE